MRKRFFKGLNFKGKEVKVMKKFALLIAVVCAVGLLVSAEAQAVPYPVWFDADNGGATYVPEIIWGWDLEAFPKEVVPAPDLVTIFGTGTGTVVDFVTHQQLGGDNTLSNGDTFYENITVSVLNGLGAPPTYQALRAGVPGTGGYYTGFPPVVPSANLYVDLQLSGSIANYVQGGVGATVANNPLTILDDSYTALFTAGNAAMYVDMNNNQTYDAVGDTLVASLVLQSAGPFIMVPSVFSGAGAIIDFGFTTTFANNQYFATVPGYPDLFDLINQGWHLTLNQGGVAVIGGEIGGLTGPVPNEILIGFQETGFDAKFEAVPEPATMLLFGSGLIGLAGLGRKKLSKKK